MLARFRRIATRVHIPQVTYSHAVPKTYSRSTMHTMRTFTAQSPTPTIPTAAEKLVSDFKESLISSDYDQALTYFRTIANGIVHYHEKFPPLRETIQSVMPKQSIEATVHYVMILNRIQQEIYSDNSTYRLPNPLMSGIYSIHILIREVLKNLQTRQTELVQFFMEQYTNQDKGLSKNQRCLLLKDKLLRLLDEHKYAWAESLDSKGALLISADEFINNARMLALAKLIDPIHYQDLLSREDAKSALISYRPGSRLST